LENFIITAILLIFIAVMLGIGIYCRKKASSSVGDFIMGGRSVGPWLTAFSYGTSYFSAVVFIGYAGQFGWNFGVSATWIGIGNALIGSLLAWMLLGRRTRIMTKHLDAATMPDFFEKRYNSKALKLVTSVIVFIFLVPYSASIYKGLSKLFEMAFDIPFEYCLIGMAVLTAAYVILGGYIATAINDFIQGIIMLIGIVLVVYTVVDGKGGLTSALTQLSQIENPTNPEVLGTYTSFFGPSAINLLGVVILTSLGTLGLPQMIHKFYTIKNEKAIKTGTVISTIFAFVVAGGSYFMGAFGRLYFPGQTVPEGGYDSIVPQMLSSLPIVLLGIVVILVLSASMSTLSSLVLTSSSTVVIDFLKGFFFKNMSNKKQILAIRILCGFFILLSVVIALNPTNLITTLMSVSWGALAGAFLGPFIYGLFWKKTTKAAVWAAIICGIGITSLGQFISIFKITLPDILQPYNSPSNFGALAMIVSLIIVPVVSLITPKLSKEHVDNSFSCYDVTVVTQHKFSLEKDS